MINKFRVYAVVLGVALVSVSLWSAFTYGDPIRPYLFGAVVGLFVLATPYASAHGKLLIERRRQADLGESTYVSPPLDVERETFLETSTAALESNGTFVGVKRREFPEGPGLMVGHTRFHGTFVRLSRDGRAIVTGVKSDAARAVVRELERIWSSTFSRSDSNPSLRPIPVRGLPRAFLVLGVTVVVILDVAFVAGLAYPSPAYNHGEKAILVGYDVRADVHPGVDETEARLGKAGFLVTVLKEEATEIRWQAGIDDSSRSSVNDAAVISGDIERLLDGVNEADLDAADRERLHRLRTERDRALADVSAAMSEPAPTLQEPEVDNPFVANVTTASTPSPPARVTGAGAR
jgi:hypothetical protein